jgi:kumamolisin
MTGIPGSARTLPSNELASKFGAQKVADEHQDVSECVIQVTAVLRSGAKADAVRQKIPTRLALREAHRPNLLDIQMVVNFARVHGLTVVDLDRPPRMVVLQGTVSDIIAAFGTTVEVWDQPWPWPDGQSIRQQNRRQSFRLRSDEDLQVPDQLAQIVQGVFGIDDRKEARMHMWAPQMHMWAEQRQAYAARSQMNTAADANSGSLDQPHSYTVEEVADKYNFPVVQDKGRGQTIAILSLGGRLNYEEFAQYFTDRNIEVPEVFEVPVDCELPPLGKQQEDEDVEVALDAHIIAALVPCARIVIYYVDNTSQGFINGLARAIYNESFPASIISISWGSYEESWTGQAIDAIEDLLKDAKALNITVCCASGDLGAWDGDPEGEFHVDYPASSPYVLSCGGTTLRPEQEEPDQREVVWSEQEVVWDKRDEREKYLASGGGESTCFDKPEWQSRRNDGGLADLRKRGVPDVAGFADPRNGFTISVSGVEIRVGGTSAAAPLWAGLIARINEKLEKSVGYLNPYLYHDACKDAFYDITKGSNGGEWGAGPGWDACTGLGSPDGGKLLEELKRLLP